VQRRHQKLIEEAPSPAVSSKLRQRMGAVAVAAVRSLRYEGAGTLEFLLDGSGEFYFMEMNTRLQVEHPVTEAITGLDLVELQLRVAGGEPLGLVQEDIKFSGHAIEVRLCSEDAEADFMPQSGTMGRWQMPEGVRVEHALRSGAEIPPFYDSMIAKIIASGSNREEARSRLICGLEQTVAFGVTTNQAFLMACLRHPAFAKGEATTSFIGSRRDELVRGDHREEAAVEGGASDAALAVLLLHVTHPHARRRRSGRTLAAAFPIPLRVEIGRSVHDLELLREREGGYRVNDGGRDYRFEIEEIETEVARFRNGVVIERVEYWRDGEWLWFLHRGVTLSARDLTLAAPETSASGGGDGKVRAAMNGRVVAVLVKQDEHVRAGQAVMTLEAMKMEHVHRAGIAGAVSAIDVTEGEQVAMGKVVVEITPPVVPGEHSETRDP
jgi:geranyl-CoA carboxylase alpha subunit